eukprot:TRINITY_DN9703_c4_g1_i1.p2 TRINITY_DN9703_c4_g1~~TRINITY_DN9703_c4_g1_i1.p2  ORF type:complete len:118 (+),score=27.55 TRINITY_DN9703_c4_g1_i1:54-356(+)
MAAPGRIEGPPTEGGMAGMPTGLPAMPKEGNLELEHLSTVHRVRRNDSNTCVQKRVPGLEKRSYVHRGYRRGPCPPDFSTRVSTSYFGANGIKSIHINEL